MDTTDGHWMEYWLCGSENLTGASVHVDKLQMGKQVNYPFYFSYNRQTWVLKHALKEDLRSAPPWSNCFFQSGCFPLYKWGLSSLNASFRCRELSVSSWELKSEGTARDWLTSSSSLGPSYLMSDKRREISHFQGEVRSALLVAQQAETWIGLLFIATAVKNC